MKSSTKLKREMHLGTPLQYVKGVGPKSAEILRKAGYYVVEDFLYHLPFRYEDRRKFIKIAQLQPGMRLPIMAQIKKASFRRIYRGNLTIFEALLDDGGASIKAIWFNQPYLRNIIRQGRVGVFFGKVNYGKYGSLKLQIENPEYEFISKDEERTIHSGRIVPIYRRIGSISSKKIRKVMYEILENVKWQIPEVLPLSLVDKYSLIERYQALRGIHFPPEGTSLEDLHLSKTFYHRRLIFEEFFLMQLGLAFKKKAVKGEVKGIKYHVTDSIRKRLASILPFKLTMAQKKVLKEIGEDLKSAHPMNRLLQGDVGSGKTIVALLAMIVAVENRFQAALMAPTEILAEQHHFNIRRLLSKTDFKVDLLTSAVTGSERKRMMLAIGKGESQIIIGTHALIQEGVKFKKLGCVIIDEQHRFGVLQRANLIEKGFRPDTLVMTATPIPRSLALTVYGDLDVSVIDELPPGRTPIKTYVRDERSRQRIYEFIRKEIKKGRQAYIVYPIIEESEKLDLKAAQKMWEDLRRNIFPEFHVGLIHGRLKSVDKEKIMSDFVQGNLHILVATTVIEVGIDVKNATIMLIENAERYGLSQLHQLRGRIGRGDRPSYCILMTGPNISEDAKRRLEVMTRSTDGFYIAEKDLEIRGPGEFLGTRQSGIPDLRIGHIIRDRLIMQAAREEAFTYLETMRKERDEIFERLMYHLRKRWGAKFHLLSAG